MKLNGIFGTGSGKIGASVWAVSSGEQIVRPYQSKVTNPNTPAQVNQRARMKLMSQLAADLAPVIAIPKVKLVSSRNRFISDNFIYSMAADGVAQVTLEDIQLTQGRNGLPQIVASRSAANGLTIALAEDSSKSINRVVYVVYKKTSDQKLQLVASGIQTEAGNTGTFSKNFDNVEGEIVLYAYGIKDTNAAATAKFSNMICQSGTDVAKLIASRTISVTDYSFTETRGATMTDSASSVNPPADGKARVILTANGQGAVAGAGTFDIGSQVTVTATPAAGYHFDGWYMVGVPGKISTEATYTFTLESTANLIATFLSDDNAGGWG